MKKILTILFSLFVVISYAQIDLEKQSNVNEFLQTKYTIASDADTSSVGDKLIGLRVRSDASNTVFEWTGTKWVLGGKSYSVATVGELAELPCNPSNWAYVVDEGAWYYCDGSTWQLLNTIDSTTTRNDSIFINVGSTEYFSGIDLGAVPIGNLAPSQITYVDSNGEIVGDSSFVVTNTGKVGIGTATPLRALHISGPEEQLRLESTGTGGVDNWLEMVNTSPNISAANIIQFYKGGNTSAHRTGSIGVPKSIGDSVIVIGLTNETGNSDDFRFYMRGGQNSYFQAEAYGDNEVTGTPATYPAFESSGRMIESTSPIGSFTSATAPLPSNPGDVHYNTDDNEVKISKDGLTWQPLVPKDTIIMQFPLLKYTGNATDTIASNTKYYATPITQAMLDRELVKWELTTFKDISTQISCVLREEDVATTTVDTLDTDIFEVSEGNSSLNTISGVTMTPGRVLQITTGNTPAPYEATEGANGFYLTLYFVE